MGETRPPSMSAERSRQLEELKGSVQHAFLKEVKAEAQVRDPAAVCGDLWFNGTSAERAAFGSGTEGRGRDEHPPKAWFDDCVATVGEGKKKESDEEEEENEAKKEASASPAVPDLQWGAQITSARAR